MVFILNIIVLIIIIILQNCSYVYSSSLYDYGLFENFELTKDIFIQEQGVVKQLEDVRNALYDQQHSVSQIGRGLELSTNEVDVTDTTFQDTSLPNKIVYPFDLKDLLLKVKPDEDNKTNSSSIKTRDIHWHKDLSHEDFSNNVPTHDIIIGASKGLLMIQETYNLNIKDFAKGNFVTKYRSVNSSRQIDSLHPDDLANMATIASTTVATQSVDMK